MIRYTQEMTALLTEKYPSSNTIELAKELGVTLFSVRMKASKLGLKKSPEFMSQLCQREASIATRFKKGQAAWNQGMKGLQIGGEATRFKKGDRPLNAFPVGHIRENHEGYLEIKSEEGMKKWRLLHRYNWMLAHGEYPPKNMSLVFIDKNRKNCAIENLELVTKKELMIRNSIQNLPPDLIKVVRLRGSINRKINKRMKEDEQRSETK